MSAFGHRGVVEGFYGRPYSHQDRLWLLEHMGAWGLNRYVYAPKGDPLHRGDWRTPYPRETLEEFAALVEKGGAAGVEVGFAVSPGLSIQYHDAKDRAELARKFQSFVEIGSRFLCLALDDVPDTLAHEADRRLFASLADAHVALANELLESLGEGVGLWLVPTEYLGVESSPYLELLGERVLPEIEIGWTGRTVVSPTVGAAEAARRSATLRRKLLLWDNVPVSDGPMRQMLHLGPYTGRDPGLGAHLSGVLLNPMQHAHASAIAICTAARWLRDPASYHPEEAWAEALDELGAGAPEALRAFACAHRFSPLWPADRDPELEAAFRELAERLEVGGDLAPALEELEALVGARREAPAQIRERLADRALLRELEPWLESHARETRRVDAALSCARVLLGESSRAEKTRAFLALEARLTREPAAGCTSYGPRRVLYPQLSSLRERDMALAEPRALVRDRNLADELVEFAEDLAVWLLTETGAPPS